MLTKIDFVIKNIFSLDGMICQATCNTKLWCNIQATKVANIQIRPVVLFNNSITALIHESILNGLPQLHTDRYRYLTKNIYKF